MAFSWSALKRRSVSLAALYRGCGLFSRGVMCLWLWVPPGRTGLGLPLVCLRDQYWVRYSTFCIRLMIQWCSPKNEAWERLEIEVETVAKSAILQEFCIVKR